MAAVFALVMALAQRVGTGWVGLGVGMVMAAALRPPVGTLVRRLCAVNMFIVFLALTVPLTMPGEPVWSLGPVHASREGLELVLLVALKANAIFLVFVALVASMDFPTMGHALERLGAPSKLTFLFLFTYRYVHVIAEEWQRLHTAARLRGFVPHTNLHTYRTVGHLLGMVLVNSFDRAGRVYQAMLLRGFCERFTSVRQFTWKRLDGVMATVWLGVVMALVATDLFGEWWHG